jgi:outer membrane autotransporter protein
MALGAALVLVCAGGTALSADWARASLEVQREFRRNYHAQVTDFRFSNGFAFADELVSSDAYAAARALGASEDRIDSFGRWGLSVWTRGFGNWGRQRDRDDYAGYRRNTYGVAAGMEKRIDRFHLGASDGYADSSIRWRSIPGDPTNRAWDNMNTMNVGVYGGYTGANFFANVYGSYNRDWHSIGVNGILGGPRSRFRDHVWGFGGSVGYTFRLPNRIDLSLSTGFDYARASNRGFTLSGAGPDIVFGRSKMESAEIPLGVRVSRGIDLGGVMLIPEARFRWIYDIGDRFPSVTAYSPANEWWRGNRQGRSIGNIGLGGTLRASNGISAFLGYDYDFRSGYRQHALRIGIGYTF